MILIIVAMIGLLSNWYSEVDVSKLSIGIDGITQIKVIFSFFAVKYFLSDKEKQTTIEMFVPIAKIFCIVACICAVLSQFVDIGMTGNDVRYGIKCFNFIFDFNFQYIATYMLLLGSIVSSKNITQKSKNIYYALAIISIALNAKSQALIFVIIFSILLIHLKKHTRINIRVIVIAAIFVYIASQYQIDTYVTNDTSVRHRFWEYGLQTANTYFPFGSGYATYGTAEAAKHYSQLYYEYGFNKVWGMSPEFGPFLCDTYWASVFGEFGWLGFILIIIVYIRIFLSFTNSNFNYDRRAFLYACFLQYVIHAIGSGVITSSSGMIGFMAMSLFTHSEVIEDKTFKLPKVKIRL
jgi:hypothetical protein